jgi:signal transduction histidine kinase
VAKPHTTTAPPNHGAGLPYEFVRGGVISLDPNFVDSVREAVANATPQFDLLSFTKASEARDALAARLLSSPARKIGFILIDGSADAERAVAMAANLRAIAPTVEILIASDPIMAADRTFIRQAFALGACDVLAGPPWSSDVLIHALHRAAWQTAAADAATPQVVAEPPSPWGERPDRNLMAEVGHEMRTPLGTMIGFAQTIEQETLGPIGSAPERYRDYARTIRTSGEHLLALFDDLLEVGAACARSIAAGETILPSDIIERSAELVRGSIDAKGLTLHIEPACGDATTVGNVTLVQQSMLNLLQNAIKFTPPGGNIWLKVCAADSIRITVRDDGVGIEEAMLHQLRKCSSGLPAPSRQSYGLGLAFVHRVAAAHSGSVELDSAVGGGTTAWLVLPTRGRTMPPAATG